VTTKSNQLDPYRFLACNDRTSTYQNLH